MLVEILTISLIAIIVVYVFSYKKKYGNKGSHVWTDEDSKDLHEIFEKSRQRSIKLKKEMEIRKEENYRPVSEEVRKEREKTWDYYDIG